LFYWLLYEKLYGIPGVVIDFEDHIFHIFNFHIFIDGRYFHLFRIFRYLTFRTAFASLTALLIALFIGPWVIKKLRQFQIGQFVRTDGPKSHQKKTGTPTMGGVLITIAILLPTVLWSDPANPFIWIAVFSTLAFGAIGFADDYIKVVKRRNLGLTVRAKLLWQGLAGAVVAVSLVILDKFKLFSTQLTMPFIKSWRPDLLWHAWPSTIPHLGLLAFLPFIAFIIFVLIGSSNAVNLTDGLDGLAIGCTIIAAGALTVLTYVSGHVVFADYLELQHMPKVAELTIFCGSMVGASIGFLWYNAHPAEIFMGDVGSLALGGAIGTVAIIIRQEMLLPFIGGIFIIEAVSVILQVGSYKLRNKKRIFKMAPLHHHFEQLGWSESKTIVRFWIGALVFALFALTTLKLR
jgi:phospho-N-acetylmuramoyl-pentapeptide-transferase